MSSVSDFDVLVYSFGEQMVAHIGRERLDSLLIRPYEGSDTADVLIRLADNTWDEQLRAMEQIDIVRVMFLGEISFEYRFLSEKETEPNSRDMAAEYRAFAVA